jgi:hypothetical protein
MTLVGLFGCAWRTPAPYWRFVTPPAALPWQAGAQQRAAHRLRLYVPRSVLRTLRLTAAIFFFRSLQFSGVASYHYMVWRHACWCRIVADFAADVAFLNDWHATV